MSQQQPLQHPQHPDPVPNQQRHLKQQQQPSHALLPSSQPKILAQIPNVSNQKDYCPQLKATNTINQQQQKYSLQLNTDQPNNHNNPLQKHNYYHQLNSRSPINTELVPIFSPDYRYQQQPYNQPETSSTIVDLESHRFAPGARSSSQQQSVSTTSTLNPYRHYYHQTQHYYPSATPNANYHNYVNYTPLPPQSQQHQHIQQQQPLPYISQQINGYHCLDQHSSYHSQQTPTTHSTQFYPIIPPQSQTKPMSIHQTTPAATTKPGPKLIWLLFMHRHGDRTPLNMAPRDKYNNITYWPEGFGNLNNAGRMRMFKLGKFIRCRYDGFLTDNVREVYSRSSDVDRCIESSHALLAGLYPPTNRFEWNKQLLWVPAPVHTVPGPDDYFLGSLKVSYQPQKGTKDQMVEFINEIHLVQNSEAVKKLYEDSVHERELLERELGYEFDMFHRFKCTYSTLDIEERNGLTMPAWYTPELKQKLYRYAGIAFSLAGGGTEKLKKIRCGLLLEDLVTRMEMSSIEGPKVKDQSDFQQLTDAPTVIDDRKIIHYSTHDSNMAAFLESLNVNTPTPVPPGFGATFFIELYVDLNEQGLPVSEKYIKLFYMDDTDSEKPIEKRLPNAKLNEKGQLTLNNFKKYIGNLLPSNSGCSL